MISEHLQLFQFSHYWIMKIRGGNWFRSPIMLWYKVARPISALNIQSQMPWTKASAYACWCRYTFVVQAIICVEYSSYIQPKPTTYIHGHLPPFVKGINIYRTKSGMKSTLPQVVGKRNLSLLVKFSKLTYITQEQKIVPWICLMCVL